jgi:hypothetical protein
MKKIGLNQNLIYTKETHVLPLHHPRFCATLGYLTCFILGFSKLIRNMKIAKVMLQVGSNSRPCNGEKQNLPLQLLGVGDFMTKLDPLLLY